VLVRRLRLGALGAVMMLGITLGFERLTLAEGATSDASCQCIGSSNVPMFGGSGTLALLAGALAAGLLTWRGAWRRRGGLPIALVGVGAVAALLWGLLSASDLFEHYDEPFGSSTSFGGTGWFTLMVVAAVAGVVASYFLVMPAAAGALLGVAAFPVLAAAVDVAWAVEHMADDGYEVTGLAPLALTAAALAVVAALAVRRARAEARQHAGALPR
jgi:hypothetical protein